MPSDATFDPMNQPPPPSSTFATPHTPDAGPALDEGPIVSIEKVRSRLSAAWKALEAQEVTPTTEGRATLRDWYADSFIIVPALLDEIERLATTPPAPGDPEPSGIHCGECGAMLMRRPPGPGAADQLLPHTCAPAPGDDELRYALRELIDAATGVMPAKVRFGATTTNEAGARLIRAIARADATLGATTTPTPETEPGAGNG